LIDNWYTDFISSEIRDCKWSIISDEVNFDGDIINDIVRFTDESSSVSCIIAETFMEILVFLSLFPEMYLNNG
jgi:hypothetical protein